MAHKIKDEMIEYLAILAQLDLNPEEKESAKKDMEVMLEYIDKLKELDTEGAEPMSHVFPLHNIFREDVPEEGRNREEMLLNAPKQKDGAYQVPKTVE